MPIPRLLHYPFKTFLHRDNLVAKVPGLVSGWLRRITLTPSTAGPLATTNNHIISLLHNPKISPRQFYHDKTTSFLLPVFSHLDNFALTRKRLLIYRD